MEPIRIELTKPPACKAGALPTELRPLKIWVVGLEPTRH